MSTPNLTHYDGNGNTWTAWRSATGLMSVFCVKADGGRDCWMQREHLRADIYPEGWEPDWSWGPAQDWGGPIPWKRRRLVSEVTITVRYEHNKGSSHRMVVGDLKDRLLFMRKPFSDIEILDATAGEATPVA